ncbi:MAG: hypothetical protein KME32_17655 [Mojavia pulchra JT2-VF2]|jgi:uncharacterized tellurite resistance protein B-like protein|uniref:Uncharacterized protein n=1 Tax=Mojavia pulchra JT2-VF2 TaxID=287848 RepID=A0A951PZH0_9NOST|nr:hypothetical protein [Mojavia pulchra JT2-VF2]
MKITRFNSYELSSQELQELEKLKTLIQNAVADGKISQQEVNDVQAYMFADQKVSVEELELYRTLVQEKFATGEIEMDYD